MPNGTTMIKPEAVADGIKAYSTRMFRETKQIEKDEKLWSRGRSREYPWKEKDLRRAIEYVIYDQGD